MGYSFIYLTPPSVYGLRVSVAPETVLEISRSQSQAQAHYTCRLSISLSLKGGQDMKDFSPSMANPHPERLYLRCLPSKVTSARRNSNIVRRMALFWTVLTSF